MIIYFFWLILVVLWNYGFPEAKPISEELRSKYLAYMEPIKYKLDNIDSNLNFE